MVDVFSKEKRSSIMSRVRARANVATELAMVSLLRQYGITGWRRHVRLFGNPDFVFARERLVLFVDGCFWHGCPLHGSVPVSNRTFWDAKLARNRARDREVNRTLRTRGWRILRVWQHDLRNNAQSGCAKRLARALNRKA